MERKSHIWSVFGAQGAYLKRNGSIKLDTEIAQGRKELEELLR